MTNKFVLQKNSFVLLYLFTQSLVKEINWKLRLYTAAEQDHRQTADIIDSADNNSSGDGIFFLYTYGLSFWRTNGKSNPIIHICVNAHTKTQTGREMDN